MIFTRIFAQTQDLQIFKKFYMFQMNPKEAFHNTAYSVQLYYIAGHSQGVRNIPYSLVTPFKGWAAAPRLTANCIRPCWRLKGAVDVASLDPLMKYLPFKPLSHTIFFILFFQTLIKSDLRIHSIKEIQKTFLFMTEQRRETALKGVLIQIRF